MWNCCFLYLGFLLLIKYNFLRLILKHFIIELLALSYTFYPQWLKSKDSLYQFCTDNKTCSILSSSSFRHTIKLCISFYITLHCYTIYPPKPCLSTSSAISAIFPACSIVLTFHIANVTVTHCLCVLFNLPTSSTVHWSIFQGIFVGLIRIWCEVINPKAEGW